MNIHVKMPSGVAINMSVAKTNTTAFIKEKIRRVMNIPVDEQHLYFRTKELKDGFTLIESNILKESTLVFERAKKAFFLYLKYVLFFLKKFFTREAS